MGAGEGEVRAEWGRGQVTADGGGKAGEDRRREEIGREPRRQEGMDGRGWGAGAAPEVQTWPSPGTLLPGTQRRTDFRSLAHARTELVHKVAGGGGAELALPVSSPPLPAPVLPLPLPHTPPLSASPAAVRSPRSCPALRANLARKAAALPRRRGKW